MGDLCLIESSCFWVRSMDDLLARGVIAVAVSSLVGGLVSGVIKYTSTHFLAAGSMHMILSALMLGYALSSLVSGTPPLFIALAIVALFTISIALGVERGYDQSTAISASVFVSVSLTALASYILILREPFGLSIVYSTLIRSPFLIAVDELLLLAPIGIALSLSIGFVWMYAVYMSFDPEYFRFVRGSLTPYRVAVYLLISLSSMYVSYILGVVPATVVVLAPTLIYSRVSSVSPLYPVLYIFLVSMASLFISYYLSIPYGGVLGIMSIAPLASLWVRR